MDPAQHIEALEGQLQALTATLTDRVAGASQETLQHLQLFSAAVEELEVGWRCLSSCQRVLLSSLQVPFPTSPPACSPAGVGAGCGGPSGGAAAGCQAAGAGAAGPGPAGRPRQGGGCADAQAGGAGAGGGGGRQEVMRLAVARACNTAHSAYRHRASTGVGGMCGVATLP